MYGDTRVRRPDGSIPGYAFRSSVKSFEKTIGDENQDTWIRVRNIHDDESSDENDAARAERRSNIYCNRMEDGATGSEGVVPDGYTLKLVHLFIRHGDRSPESMNSNLLKAREFDCSMKVSGLPLDYKLKKYVEDMEEIWDNLSPHHDARSWGLYPQNSTCGLGELTAQGAYQHMKLGQHLRKAYIDRGKLLPEEYDPNLVHVRATLYNRTHQSAIALLYGLLPEFDFSKIWIRPSKNIFFCSEELSKLSCGCSHQSITQAYISEVEEMPEAKEKSAYGSKIKRIIAHKFKFPLESLNSHSLLDTLNTYICHNKPLPCSAYDETRCFTWSYVVHLWNSLDMLKEFRGTHPAFKNLKLRAIYPLLREIAQRIRAQIRGDDTRRFVLYSGNDILIHAFAVGFGIDLGAWPPFASRIALEVYKKEHEEPGASGIDNYYFKFLYNGKDTVQYLTFCYGQVTDNGLCPLQNFLDYLRYRALAAYDNAFSKWCTR